ncbi:hypothetical protein [Dankookia sp. P2]|uniref:hypothetical protein n=1 Tax=Dankookia sp. P2 TaxID=3423955 RepID=UPI003D67E2F0
MCRRWSTSWPEARDGAARTLTARLTLRLLLGLALLLAPLAARQVAPVATIPVCTAEGGVRHIPDPLAPAVPGHDHCEACLAGPPALPVPAAGLRPPAWIALAWAAAESRHAAPAALPPERARAPPAT